MADELTLPSGWEKDDLLFHGCTVLKRPQSGYVTIDWGIRKFCLGISRPRGFRGDEYSGRGWKERLLADAIRALDEE